MIRNRHLPACRREVCGRAALLVTLALLAGSCGQADSERAAATRDDDAAGLVVLTTVDPITDLAQHVLGDRGVAHSLVAEGDAHTFEPAPQDAILMGQADLFLANGLGLNDAATALAEANLPAGAPLVTLADLTLDEDDVVVEGASDTGGADAVNPHVWMDVTYAIAYVGHITEALVAVDPEGEDIYRANARTYTAELQALDAAIMEATATIPEENRTLVSYHDSWAYYAPRYGLRHVDAVQPSDYAEPSAAEVRMIIDEIAAIGVPVVFGAREFPSDVLRTIATETGARYVGDLSDDEFPGEPGDPEHSYIGMMVHNARTITEGLGGDASALDKIDPAEL